MLRQEKLHRPLLVAPRAGGDEFAVVPGAVDDADVGGLAAFREAFALTDPHREVEPIFGVPREAVVVAEEIVVVFRGDPLPAVEGTDRIHGEENLDGFLFV